jgi:oxepin-CoA hydrolase/3-oxo-5,6-dehydrosuberyl-CoA semialdehyde dehydrogenase
VAVQINAFNFPVWGMLEKLAPAILAGVLSIVKPAMATAYLAHTAFRMIIESGLLPDGAVQLIIGGVGDLLNHLGPKDVVSFTGSAATGVMLQSQPNLIRQATRLVAEEDSLNATVLGPDVTQDAPEFGLFITEAVRAKTMKAGQKCTVIRRIIVPEPLLRPVAEAVSAGLADVRIGDPALEATGMGPLVSRDQRADVQGRMAQLEAEADCIFDGADLTILADNPSPGAFQKPTLYCFADPDQATAVHRVEAFGPVATLMPYRDIAHAAALANRGGGSAEELGGIGGMVHYMQRVAVQGRRRCWPP